MTRDAAHRHLTEKYVGKTFGALHVEGVEWQEEIGQHRLRVLCAECGRSSLKRSGDLDRRGRRPPRHCGCSFARGPEHGNADYVGPISRSWFSRHVVENAKARVRSCTITREDLARLWTDQGGRCALTGVDLNFDEATDPLTNASVDRIDPGRGYEPGNVRWVSVAVNIVRGDGDDRALKWFLFLIVTFEHEKALARALGARRPGSVKPRLPVPGPDPHAERDPGVGKWLTKASAFSRRQAKSRDLLHTLTPDGRFRVVAFRQHSSTMRVLAYVRLKCVRCRRTLVRDRRVVHEAGVCRCPCESSRAVVGEQIALWRQSARRRRRRRDFSLTQDNSEAIIRAQGNRCAITGMPFRMRPEGRGLHVSPDRLDGDLGYTPDNVQFVLPDANIRRWKLSMSQLRSLAHLALGVTPPRYAGLARRRRRRQGREASAEILRGIEQVLRALVRKAVLGPTNANSPEAQAVLDKLVIRALDPADARDPFDS